MLYFLLFLPAGFLHAQVPPAPVSQRQSQPQQQEAPALKPEELCTVEGIVRNASTGEPLRKAEVVMMRTGTPGAGSPSVPSTTSTDGEGKFAMTKIEPGQYRLMATRNGFVRSEYGARGTAQQGTTLTFDKGQALKSLEIKLAPHSVVTGKILDEDREPVPNASVQLMQARVFQGRKQLMPVGFAQTNDLGEYRIFGIPGGKYILSATSRMVSFSTSQDRSANAQPGEEYVPTYYPGTNDATSATQLRVPVGGKVDGMDFTMRKARTFRVKGQVLGAPGGANRNRGGMVSMTTKSSEGLIYSTMNRNMSNWRGPKGEFEIRGVRPGSYLVRSEYFESSDTRLFAVAQVEVTERDVEGVILQLAPGIEVTGSIRTEGEGQINLEDITVYLEARNEGMMMGGNSARVKENGSFKVQYLPAAEFQVRTVGLPAEYYLKSVRSGDTDALKDGLDLARAGTTAAVDVLISPAAAQLDGSAVDEKGNAVVGAIVVLRSTMGDAYAQSLHRQVTTDQRGQFKIQSVTPGEYKLYAFETIEGTDPQDPDLLAQYDSSSVKVKLGERAKETRQLKAVREDPSQR